jgi:hypothetical protein
MLDAGYPFYSGPSSDPISEIQGPSRSYVEKAFITVRLDGLVGLGTVKNHTKRYNV